MHGGRIVLERPGAPALRVTDLTLLTRRAALPARAHGSVSGRLWSGPDPLGSFELAIDVRAGELTVTGELFDLELANLPLPEATSVRGSATGRIGARRERGGLLEADFDLELEGLEFEHAALRGTIAPRHARVAGMVSWDGEALLLRASPLALEDLVLRGELQIQTGPGARVRASIDAEDFEPGVPSLGRIHALSLLGRRFETWARADHRTEAGRIENIHLEADLPLDGLADSLGFARKLEPSLLWKSRPYLLAGGSSFARPLKNAKKWLQTQPCGYIQNREILAGFQGVDI